MQLNQERDPVIQELITNDLLTEEQVKKIENEKVQSIRTAKQAIAGKHYSIDLTTYQLSCSDTITLKEEYNISLPKPEGAKMVQDEWEQFGTDWTLFNLETCKKEADIAWSPQTTLGFVAGEVGNYLSVSENELLNTPYLALATHLLYSAFPKSKGDALPLDIYWSKQQKYLALTDRGAGKIHIVDPQEGKLLNSLSIRNPGSAKAINLAIAEDAAKMYVSDNSTAKLTVIDLNDFSTDKISPGVGILGNLVITHDEQFLYLVATKPKPGINVFEISSNSIAKDISIKGDLFSTNSDNPCDLMSLTPNGENLLFTTYINDPKPFTPVISVISIEKKKTTARFSIKDGSSPSLLAFSMENPVALANRNLVELLVEQDLISDEDVNNARRAMRQREIEEQMKQDEAANRVGQVIDMEQKMLDELEKEDDEDEDEEEEEGAFKPEKVEQAVLSPAGVELITNHCVDIIYSETDIKIDADEDCEDAFGRLQMAAQKALNEMEWYNGAIIKLKELFEGYTFKTALKREVVQDWLHVHERDSLVKDGLKTIPSQCPNCTKPLFGSYICSNCGYKIESPEELLKRGLVSIASASPVDYLPKGHTLLVDMQHKRIIEVDINHELVWELSKGMLSAEVQIELEFPRDAVRLSTRNTLITDYAANRVVEMTPRGRIFWELNTGWSPEHQLKNPVKATSNGINQVLIVDQGHHRIIEVDRDQEIVYDYGTKDTPGIEDGFLNMPSDAQRLVNGNVVVCDTGNHRIIELERRKIVWQYGNPENVDANGYGAEAGMLCYPQSALRMDNGNTLIVDSGNTRVIEVNKDGEIVWQHNTAEGPPEKQVDAPFRASKLPNGVVVILGETSVIEVNQFEKDPVEAVIWSCKLTEFEVKTEKKAQVVKVKRGFLKHGVKRGHMMKNTDEEDKKKKEMELKMQEMLKKRMAARKSAGANKAHVAMMKGAKLGPFDFFLVDRTRNRILKTRRDGAFVWRYGDKAEEKLNKPHFCVPTGRGNILVADTDHHRIFALSPKSRKVLWEYGQKGQSGKEGLLNRPRSVRYLTNENFLITDQNNARVIEVTLKKEVVWTLEGLDNLIAPFYAERLANGNTLISDWGGHYVLEVNPEGQKVWSFGSRKESGNDDTHLAYPEFATRLENGNTMICDSRNGRVIEVDADGNIKWKFAGDPKNKLSGPTYARRLKNGNTIVTHNHNRQIYEVDPKNRVLWKYMLPLPKKKPPSKGGTGPLKAPPPKGGAGSPKAPTPKGEPTAPPPPVPATGGTAPLKAPPPAKPEGAQAAAPPTSPAKPEGAQAAAPPTSPAKPEGAQAAAPPATPPAKPEGAQDAAPPATPPTKPEGAQAAASPAKPEGAPESSGSQGSSTLARMAAIGDSPAPPSDTPPSEEE